MIVKGTFDVTMNPLDFHVRGQDGVQLGRMGLDKRFEGELDATSKGEMLSAMTPVEGSAGYVAIEQVSGTLSGKKGSFVLQHFGTMSGGGERLLLEVVPHSGTGELTGLRGSMAIVIEAGHHHYEFDYALD
jgi:hypothetical protein